MQHITVNYTNKSADKVPVTTHQTYHFHPCDEMLIVHSGDIVAMTPGTYLSHKGPCIIFYKKMCPHAQINMRGTAYERFCISFERNSLIEFLPNLSLFTKFCKDDAFLLPLNEEEDSRLFTAARLLDTCVKNNGDDTKTKLLLSYILAEITDISSEGENNCPVHFYLTEVTQYITLHINQKLTIDDIAKEFKISRTKLIRDFKEFFGMSVLEYITCERISIAKEMLRRGETVLKVAENCGFIDSAYFIRVFKKNVGITPAAYRKKSAENPNKYEKAPIKINL